MRSMKWSNLSRAGCAMLLTAGLLVPGLATAAIVSGSTTQSLGGVGEITLSVEVDGPDTEIAIEWPENRWVGISFGPTPAHDGGYMIIAKLDGSADEYNALTRPGLPVLQGQQDLSVTSFSTSGGVSEILLSRDSITTDSDDFPFFDVEQVIPVQYALGWDGDLDIFAGHEIRGYFDADLELTLIPVPAALPLLASGLFALGLVARRKKTV